MQDLWWESVLRADVTLPSIQINQDGFCMLPAERDSGFTLATGHHKFVSLNANLIFSKVDSVLLFINTVETCVMIYIRTFLC